jgi:hypothetical protein
MKVKLKFNLIFDAEETWQSTADFEQDFAKFLESKGLIGEKIQCSNDENSYEQYVLIQKQELQVAPATTNSPAKQKTENTSSTKMGERQ